MRDTPLSQIVYGRKIRIIVGGKFVTRHFDYLECKHCGEQLTARRITSGDRKGLLYSSAAHNKRTFCGPHCQYAYFDRQSSKDDGNSCDVCGKLLSRKRRANGSLEPRRQYMARRTCGPGTACYTAQKKATATVKNRIQKGITVRNQVAYTPSGPMDQWLYGRGRA